MEQAGFSWSLSRDLLVCRSVVKALPRLNTPLAVLEGCFGRMSLSACLTPSRPGHQCCQGHNAEFRLAMPQPPLSTALCPTTCDSVVSSHQDSSSKVALPLSPRDLGLLGKQPPTKPTITSVWNRFPRPAPESSGFREHTVRGAISACRARIVELRTLLGLYALSRPGQPSVLKGPLTDDCTRFPDPQQAWASVWFEDRN